MTMERHSYKNFGLAIVILAIVAITFFGGIVLALHELNETQNTLLLVESELGETQTQLADAKAKLATVEIELTTSKEDVGSLEATLSNLRVNYARLTTGYGYVLRDPSYQEMRNFLARDGTSEREWVRSEYTCVDFAADVKANAAMKGIRSAFVLIEYPEAGGHAIVAFNTTDRGLVFIEPQFDWKAEPRIGQRYYQSVRPPPNHIMASPDLDDTITRIIIIW